MYTLNDKICTTVLAGGACGWAWYGCVKFVDAAMDYVWSTKSDKLRSIGKGVLAGIGYAGSCVGAAALTIAAIQMWKDK